MYFVIIGFVIYALIHLKIFIKGSKDNIQKLKHHINIINYDMVEVLDKTNKAIRAINDNDIYMSLVNYICGHCWINSKLSNNQKLSNDDIQQINNINYIIHTTEPMETELYLFHGFEKYTKYDEHNYKISNIINLKGFLSKTLSFDVAEIFAKHYNFFHRKFIVVQYSKQSKQISQNIRLVGHNEYEYITFSNEKLIIIDIVQYFQFPCVYTFFICELLIK